MTNEEFAKKWGQSPVHSRYIVARLADSGKTNEGLTGFLAEFASTPETAKEMLADLGKSENSPLVKAIDTPGVELPLTPPEKPAK